MFKSAKQRAFYFAKKGGKDPKNSITTPPNTITTKPTSDIIKLPGLPKANKFGRIKRYFKF